MHVMCNTFHILLNAAHMSNKIHASFASQELRQYVFCMGPVHKNACSSIHTVILHGTAVHTHL
jgi:hypothetical protein